VAWLNERRPDWSRRTLLPVVVQDATGGTLLMLAWANEAAVAATETSGRAHFWSRSRDELWRKGATSGNEMVLVDLAVDCDGDAIRYRVAPTGPACHTGARSCWDGPGGEETAALDLAALEAIIASRRDADPTTSYTARILAGGARRPAEKVTEEAGELSAAALVGTDVEVRAEAADLLYHVLLLLAARDVSLRDVLGVLGTRHGR
jgi:phosphoribosyl-ATP pyrophosphohydrolase/phosphoribosyl-AMP cyclohydrolase